MISKGAATVLFRRAQASRGKGGETWRVAGLEGVAQCLGCAEQRAYG